VKRKEEIESWFEFEAEIFKNGHVTIISGALVQMISGGVSMRAGGVFGLTPQGINRSPACHNALIFTKIHVLQGPDLLALDLPKYAYLHT
jgi:hypothetical protein